MILFYVRKKESPIGFWGENWNCVSAVTEQQQSYEITQHQPIDIRPDN